MKRTMSYKRTYQCYCDMKQRCLSTSCHNYKNYGARGISVCPRWLESFENFILDMGEKPAGLTLERIDNNGNYEPVNCRWASRAEQRRNQRDCINIEYQGRIMTLEEWGRELGIHPTTIRHRIHKRHLTPVEALALPARPGFSLLRRAAMKEKP